MIENTLGSSTPKPPEGGFNAKQPTPKPPEGGFNTRVLGLVSVLLMLLFSGCREQQKPVQGNGTVITHIDSITVYCDEAFKYLIDQEIKIYEFEQPDQHIHAEYMSESEVMKTMLKDSFSSAVLGRRLTEKEISGIFRNSNLQINEHTFATDAIAIIANPGLDRDTLAYDAVLSLLTNRSQTYNLVFEGNGSGVIDYMFSQIAHSSVHPSAYAAKNIDELVEYIGKDKKTLGFIPYARISDEDDKAARELLKKVKVMYFGKLDTAGKMIYSTACQSDIADGSYPFDRPINFISHSMNEKVGTGFVNFLYREQSGRIVLKSGLIPFNMPQRVINVNTDPIK